MRGFGPDGAQPTARGEGGGEQFVSRVGGLGHHLPCPPQGPGGMQVVEGWQIAADRLICRADDTLQPALMLGCDVPDGDVEVIHSSYWGVTQSDGAAFILKSTTISTVFRALSSRWFFTHQVTRWSISHL